MSNNNRLLSLLIRNKFHLGFVIKTYHYMYEYILGYTKNNLILNLNFTYYTFKQSFFFIISAISFNLKFLIIGDFNFLLKQLFNKKTFTLNCFNIWGFEKWSPGFLTNFEIIRKFLILRLTKKQVFHEEQVFELKEMRDSIAKWKFTYFLNNYLIKLIAQFNTFDYNTKISLLSLIKKNNYVLTFLMNTKLNSKITRSMVLSYKQEQVKLLLLLKHKNLIFKYYESIKFYQYNFFLSLRNKLIFNNKLNRRLLEVWDSSQILIAHELLNEQEKLHYYLYQKLNLEDISTKPRILLVFNAHKYQKSIYEAYRNKIPVIAIVNSQCTTDLLNKITYIIPTNLTTFDGYIFMSRLFLKIFKIGRKKYLFNLVNNNYNYGFQK